MYYDTRSRKILSDRDIEKRGLTAEGMAALGICPIREIRPDIDGRYESLRPGEVEVTEAGCVRRWEVAPLPLPFAKAAKKEDATALRWAQETGGIITPDGIRVLTGIEDQNRIATAIQGMRDSGITEVDFKSASGWVTLTLDQLVGVAALIAEHVQACFTRERALYEAIDACVSLEALNALDLNAGWPGAAEPEDAESEQAQDPDASGQVSADAGGSA